MAKKKIVWVANDKTEWDTEAEAEVQNAICELYDIDEDDLADNIMNEDTDVDELVKVLQKIQAARKAVKTPNMK
jgi:hypothetical protein